MCQRGEVSVPDARVLPGQTGQEEKEDAQESAETSSARPASPVVSHVVAMAGKGKGEATTTGESRATAVLLDEAARKTAEEQAAKEAADEAAALAAQKEAEGAAAMKAQEKTKKKKKTCDAGSEQANR